MEGIGLGAVLIRVHGIGERGPVLDLAADGLHHIPVLPGIGAGAGEVDLILVGVVGPEHFFHFFQCAALPGEGEVLGSQERSVTHADGTLRKNHVSVTVIGNDAAEVLVAVAVDMVNAALLVIAEGVEPSHVVVCHALQLVSLPGEFVRQLTLVGLVAHGFPLSRHKHFGLEGGSFVNARNLLAGQGAGILLAAGCHGKNCHANGCKDTVFHSPNIIRVTKIVKTTVIRNCPSRTGSRFGCVAVPRASRRRSDAKLSQVRR